MFLSRLATYHYHLRNLRSVGVGRPQLTPPTSGQPLEICEREIAVDFAQAKNAYIAGALPSKPETHHLSSSSEEDEEGVSWSRCVCV